MIAIVLVAIYMLTSCADKDGVIQPQPPAEQNRFNAEFIEMGNEFMFCKNNLCCNGWKGHRYATCSWRAR